MCDQTSFFFIKDCEATSFSWTLFAFSHFNAIFVASAFIVTLQKENFLAMKVFESVSERNPKLGGLGLESEYDCSTNIQKVELSPLDDCIFVQNVHICPTTSQNDVQVKIFCNH